MSESATRPGLYDFLREHAKFNSPKPEFGPVNEKRKSKSKSKKTKTKTKTKTVLSSTSVKDIEGISLDEDWAPSAAFRDDAMVDSLLEMLQVELGNVVLSEIDMIVLSYKFEPYIKWTQNSSEAEVHGSSHDSSSLLTII